MINLTYKDELDKTIRFEVNDWDAIYRVAEGLVNAPIDLEYIEYQDGNQVGIFNLNTFERC